MEKQEKYSVAIRYMHVVGGLAFVAALVLGLVMDDMERGSAKFELMFFHKSLGLAVMGLVAFRLLELFRSGAPAPLENHKKWEVLAAKAVKIGLYGVMIVMPFSGVLMSWSAGYPAEFFGLFQLQPMIDKSPILNDFMDEIHDSAVPLIMLLLALHIGGAIKHKIVDKDATLQRISPLPHS